MYPNSCSGIQLINSPQVIPNPSQIPLTIPMVQNKDRGWVCPKCDSVWGPFIPSCLTCNKPNSDVKSSVT